jgi:hypothetical protein
MWCGKKIVEVESQELRVMIVEEVAVLIEAYVNEHRGFVQVT